MRVRNADYICSSHFKDIVILFQSLFQNGTYTIMLLLKMPHFGQIIRQHDCMHPSQGRQFFIILQRAWGEENLSKL